MREKKRYVAFEVVSKEKLEGYAQAYNAFVESVVRLLGSRGVAEIGPVPVKKGWNTKRQRGIVRVSAKKVDEAKAAIAAVTHIQSHEAIMRSVGTSGIMKKAIERYINPGR